MSYELVRQEEIQALKTKIAPLISEAKLAVVTNGNQYRLAGERVLVLKTAKKNVEAKLNPVKAQAYAAYKGISNLLDEFLNPLEAAIKTYGQRMLSWKMKEDRKQREEQLRAEVVAREEQRKLEEQRFKAAVKAENKGDTAMATQLLETPVIVPVPKVETTVPKVNGIKVRKLWRARIVDRNLIPDEYWIVNEDALNALARATKGTAIVFGVQFYEELGGI